MATRYTSTINVRCWKQHTCVACGGQFSYLFVRKVVGNAGTAAGAQKAAENIVKKRLAGDTDSQPCPTCGIYQPDMTGQRRAKAQGWLFAASVLAVIILFVLSATHTLQDDVFLPSAAIALAVIGIVQFFVDARRPNRDLDANKQKALAALQQGTLRVDKPGQMPQGVEEPWRAKGSLLRPAAYVLCLLGLIAIPTPSIVRSSQSWPFNANCYPPVVGPGDSTCFYMRQTIHSVKGYFRGTVKASAREGGHTIGLGARSRDADWGNSIQVDNGEKEGSARLWVTLILPNKPELAGKELQCDIDLAATYPVADPARDTFHVEQHDFQDSLTLQAGPPHSGDTYRTIWWFGALGGMGCFLFSGILRICDARRLRKQALPTAVCTIAEAESQAAPSE